MDPIQFFSATALDAQNAFDRAAAARGAPVDRHVYPAAGPEGEGLVTAVTRIGARDAPNVLLIISGIHGVEGFAGSGLQTGLLLDASALDLPTHAALVLVHLLNPWGMAWNRREDHENIDVFRNLLYHDSPIVADPLFDVIEDAIDLPSWGDPNRNDTQRRDLVERYGIGRLIAAIRRGQHHRPKGTTYHGNGPCWSTRTMHAIVDRYLGSAKHIAVLDVHTGFGEPGQGLVMSYERCDSPKYERARSWVDKDFYTPGTDDDIPAHARAPYGFIEQRVHGSKVTALILEFGTEPPEVTRDLFPMNAFHHLYGDPRSEPGRAVGARYRKFCYPETEDWKRAVWERGAEVTRQVIAGLERWSRDR